MAASALSSGSPAVSPPPRAVLERPLFSIAGRIFRWQDVFDAGRHWGGLATLEWQAAEGIAALDLAGTAGPPLDDAEIEAKADDFRHKHKLLAADELEAWLARWELDYDDLLAYGGRALARARLDGRLESAVASSPPDRGPRGRRHLGRRRSAPGSWPNGRGSSPANSPPPWPWASRRAASWPRSGRRPTSARGVR